MEPSSRMFRLGAGGCVLALAIAAIAGCGTDDGNPVRASGTVDQPVSGATSLDDARSPVESVFESRYGINADQLWVVDTDATKVATLVGPDMVASERSVSLVYALGEFTDSMAHPPPGYELPTGKTAYLVINDFGTILGGGVFADDRTEEIESLAAPTPWSARVK